MVLSNRSCGSRLAHLRFVAIVALLVAAQVAAQLASMPPVAAEPASDEAPPPATAADEEVVALRTAFSKTFTTTKARQYQTRISATPIHFQDSSGAWVPIDTTLVSEDASTLRAAANGIGLRLGTTAASPQLGRVELDDTHAASFGLAGALPVPAVVAGSTATYLQAIPGVDVKLTSLAAGLKEELVLTSRVSPNEFTYPLTLEGLTASIGADGSVEYRDETGDVAMRTPKAWAEDATAEAPTGQGKLTQGSYELVTAADGKLSLKLTIARDWLDDPARVYPVTVDPIWSAGAGRSASYYSGGITEEPGSVKIGNPAWDTWNVWRSVVYFPYESLYGKTIEAATVSLSSLTEGNNGALDTCLSHATEWGFNGYDPGTEMCIVAGGDRADFVDGQVLSQYRTAIANQWGGWALSFAGNECGGCWTYRRYDSFELRITWQEPNRPPNTPDSLSPTGNPWVGTRTPTLSARGTDPDNNPLYFRFRVNGPTNASLNDGQLRAQPFTYNYVPPTLADGGYSWSVWTNDQLADSPTASGSFRVDLTAPSTPGGLSSDHSANVWSSNPAVSSDWGASSDNYAGVAGYAAAYGTASGADPGATNAAGGPFVGTLGDGTWWFNVKAVDNAGNASGVASYGPIKIDATKPAISSLSASPQADQNGWYTNNTPTFSWASSDTSGICDYNYDLDRTGTGPVSGSKGTATSYQSPAPLSDGVWYFNLQAKNCAGLWSDTVRYKVQIAAGAPGSPRVSSSTHPDSTKWYRSRDAAFSWLPAVSDPSPAAGYSYLGPDALPVNDPPQTSKGTGTSSAATVPADGTWYFHVRTLSSANVWGPTANFAFGVDTAAPLPPTGIASTTHAPKISTSKRQIKVNWTPGTDATSGVAGYSWQFNTDRNQQASGTKNAEAAPTEAMSAADLADGVYWFHIKTIDKAGNVSDDAVSGPYVIDANAPAGLSPTLTADPVAQSDERGLEQFQPFARHDLGAANASVQLRTGNAVVQQDDTRVPGQGLNTVVRRTYNSQDSTDTGLSPGWRLSVSDLDGGLEGAEGAITDLDPANALKIADIVDVDANNVRQVVGQIVEFTDGDGTTHRFVRNGSRWDSPPGVSLRVSTETAGGTITAYNLTRPDGVTYRAENIQSQAVLGLTAPTWVVTRITDRNNNRLTYAYTTVTVNGTPRPRLATITHSRTPDRTTVSFQWEAGTGRLQSITSLPGVVDYDPAAQTNVSRTRRTDLAYTSGRLTSVTHNAQDATMAQGRRTTVYGYDSAGTLADVTDGRNNTSRLGYTTSSGARRLTTFTDRRGGATSYSYADPDPQTGEVVTTATSPVGAKTTYSTSGRRAVSATDARIAGGNITRISDAGNNAGTVTQRFGWEENWLTTKTDGAGATTTLAYNDLGLVTKITAPAPNDPARADLGGVYPTGTVESTLAYAFGGRAPGCTEPPTTGTNVSKAGYCDAVADLTRTVEAANLAAQARTTDFVYDTAGRGNLTSVTKVDAGGAASRTTSLDYYSSGALCRVDGPRTDVGDVTRYGDAANTAAGSCATAPDPVYGGYDPTGQPSVIRDAADKTKTFRYSPYGPALAATDRENRTTLTVYDDRDNPVRVTDPAGRVTTAAFDGIDLKYRQTSARAAAGEPGDFATNSTYDPNGWLIKTSAPDASGTDTTKRVETSSTYNDDGTKATDTNAAGGVTTYDYYPNRALKTVLAPAATTGPKARTDYQYDTAGRQTRVELPATSADGVTRPYRALTYTPQGAVSVETESSAVDGQDKVTRRAYNAHGEEAQVAGPRTDAATGEAAKTEWDYNTFGEQTATRRRLPGRWLTSTTDYDAAGNKVGTAQPTGTGGVLESRYRYDNLNRLAAQTKDPSNPDHEVTYTYDGEGEQTTRTDLRQTAGSAAAACGESGVACAVERTATTAYNPDGTVSSTVSVDGAGNSVATCNWSDAANKLGGYDADRNLLYTRTATGTLDCAGGQTTRELNMSYDNRGLMTRMDQAVRSPETAQLVKRTQLFEYRNDGATTKLTHGSEVSTYTYSPAGYLEGGTDFRGKRQTITNTPAGAPATESLGDGAVTSARAYTTNGMPRSLQWTGRSGTILRDHTAITYDLGDQRLSENVAVTQPADAVGADTGGPAAWSYDLAGRLTGYTSPYRQRPLDTTEARTAYTLDDGGNTTRQTTTVAGVQRSDEASTYVDGQLRARRTTTAGLVVPATTDTTFAYTTLGEEKTRTTTGGAGGGQNTTYDPAGRTAAVDQTTADDPDVDYLYDGGDRMIARTERPAVGNPTTTLYFYWGTGTTLAEETDGQGATLAKYATDAGTTTWGQQTYRRGTDGRRDTTDTTGTWAWLLDDDNANTATHAADDGTVTEQAAFDPYGRPEQAGNGRKTGTNGSSIGYQSAVTDKATGSISLGARLYDPLVGNFTTPDTFIASSLDLALGTDELTGNRYLFAASNPVAFYEDGHAPCRRNSRCRIATGAYPGNRGCPRYDAICNAFGVSEILADAATRAKRAVVSRIVVGGGSCYVIGCAGFSYRDGRTRFTYGWGLGLGLPGVGVGLENPRTQRKGWGAMEDTFFLSTPVGGVSRGSRSGWSFGYSKNTETGWGAGWLRGKTYTW